MLRTGADRRGHEAEGEGAPPAHSREMSEQDMFRACFPKALSVQRTCTRNAWGAAHQACVSNSGSLKFRSGRPTLGSRICDALSNENIWAWARGGCRCCQHIWWESGFNLVPAASAAELSPNIGELSTVFTRRPPPSPAYQNICSLMPPPPCRLPLQCVTTEYSYSTLLSIATLESTLDRATPFMTCRRCDS